MARVYLTNSSVEALRAQATNAGKVFTDDRLKGFLFKVGTDGGGTFYLQREVGKRAVRVALGKLGTLKPDNKPMTATDFRALAEEVRGELTRANKAAATNPAEATRIVSEVRSRLDEAGAPKRPTARAEAFRDEDDAQTPGPRPDDTWETFTVQQAMEEHFRNMRTKGRDRSVPQARDEAKRYLGDWLPLPIAGIRRRDCIDQHRRICENHGNTVANKSFRLFRAFWYSAAARFDVDDERANPVRRMPWAPEKQGQPIPWSALPAWAAGVNGIGNPVRRDWYWFVLLTALRNGDARRVRWEELNLTDRPKRYVNAQGEKVELEPFSMHRPEPKGGERKAFTVPLSRPVVELLKRRREENEVLYGDDGGWVFPTRDKGGRVTHLSEPKEQDYMRDDAGRILRFVRVNGQWVESKDGKPRKFSALPNPHRLRHTFATTADEPEVGASERVMKALMNHTPDGANMNHRYNKPTMDAMRAATEKVAAFLLKRCGTGPGAANPAGEVGPRLYASRRASANPAGEVGPRLYASRRASA